MTDIIPGAISYRLTKKSPFWILWTPAGTDHNQAWQMQVSARARGGARTLAVLLETTPLRPLVTLTLKKESYPLAINWHEMRRGVLCFGGARKLGQNGELSWEMRWKPVASFDAAWAVELRIRATPRREGRLSLELHAPLHGPEPWSVGLARGRGQCAEAIFSPFSGYGVGLVMPAAGDEDQAGWDEARRAFVCTRHAFPLGGGRKWEWSLQLLAGAEPIAIRGPLVAQYAASAAGGETRPAALAALQPAATVARLTGRDAYDVQGAERLYLKPPVPHEAGVYFAGAPYFPADALLALSHWARLHPSDILPRLVRFGARGIATDFQVMGRGDAPEPNKGAFWDKKTGTRMSDFGGGATHGLASNARLSRSFFLLHEEADEPLLRQAALNICQWLILKQNEDGYFDGERVHATRGLSVDGKVIPQPCALDGAEAIRPLVLAYRATAQEVFLKAAWKIARFLMDRRLPEYDTQSPRTVASVILALLALDGEAPNERLRRVLRAQGGWLRTLPLATDSAMMNTDGLSDGLFECAEAGFRLYALDRDPDLLRYAFTALGRTPVQARAASWRAIVAFPTAMLALACLLPDMRADFDALSVSRDWRTWAPDPATDQFVAVETADGRPVDFLPLVCRGSGQLLLIALAPPDVHAVTVCQSGRRPLVRDLLTGMLDGAAPLHPLLGEDWARVGLFTIDP